MKQVLILFFSLLLIHLVLASSAGADVADVGEAKIDPTRFCDHQSCTDTMKFISNQYRHGNSLFAHQDLSAFSGACYHINPDYYPEQAHYGVMAFQNQKQSEASSKIILINGFFGFFYNEDPYEKSSAAEIFADLNQKSKPSQGSVFSNYVMLQYLTEQSQIRYWFRNSSDLSHLYLIGLSQGFGQGANVSSNASKSNWENYIFCDLHKK